MLWDSIFEFYVRYVFGGYIDINGINSTYNGIMGPYDPVLGRDIGTAFGNVFELKLANGSTYNMPIGNYLSLIATIVSITIIVVLCCLFIKKIVSLVGGLIR